jgi:hypothetical protein
MNADEILHTIAQVGVSLAGFAALVALFRNRSGSSWTPASLSALRSLIELSLCTVVLALLPLSIALFEIPEFLVWQVSSLCALLAGLGLMTIAVLRVRALVRSGWKAPTWLFHLAGFAIGCLALLAQAYNVLAQSAAIYVAVLLALIVIVGLQFIVSVSSGRATRD